MPEPATKLEVEVTEPAVRHRVNYGSVMRWLNQGSANSAEEVKRKRLRELLEAK